MSEKNTINFAIDLGTTNSVICKSESGNAVLFKNPVGQKETLPSVVGFRRDRVIVGDKAREYLEKDSKNVVGLFKRKMGTDFTYPIASLNKSLTPTELSSYVLKEIKNFVTTGENVDSVVITIPASFDTVQSNATKEAGLLAGFNEVILLQEPIAASLAFINQFVKDEQETRKWVVYDLGGGTFDVALLSLEDGEIKVLDHKGDNFMGGLDFDDLIFEKIVLPHLTTLGNFKEDLKNEFKSASGSYHKDYYKIIKKCEDLKVTLSTSNISEIEFEIEDINGDFIDFFLEVSRDQMNTVLAGNISDSIDFIELLLKENGISSSQLDAVLLVGGSTFIPLVRQELKDRLSTTIETRIDPISAVAVGASYYASTRVKSTKTVELADEKIDKDLVSNTNIKLKFAYQKQSVVNEEYFTAVVLGETEGHYYRIMRKDGGYDSGLKTLQSRIEEDLPLLSDTCNQFDFVLFDSEQNKLESGTPLIEINQGKFGILGQPLPEDICLEIDDIIDGSTGLQLVFKKNDVLPLRKKIIKEVTKTISMNSDESIIINVLEGPQSASPISNKPIGIIKIDSKKLDRDLIKGTDVEITIEMSESRDLKIKTLLTLTDQEFEDSFSATKRYVDLVTLKEEVFMLLDRIDPLLQNASENEDFVLASKLQNYEAQVRQMYDQICSLKEDDVTDAKFKIENTKRNISYALDSLDAVNKQEEIINELKSWQQTLQSIFVSTNTLAPELNKEFNALDSKVTSAIGSGNKIQLRNLVDSFAKLHYKAQKDTPEFITQHFLYLKHMNDAGYKDEKQAKKLFKEGEKALEKENFTVLKSVVNSLWSLVPEDRQKDIDGKRTGIS